MNASSSQPPSQNSTNALGTTVTLRTGPERRCEVAHRVTAVTGQRPNETLYGSGRGRFSFLVPGSTQVQSRIAWNAKRRRYGAGVKPVRPLIDDDERERPST